MKQLEPAFRNLAAFFAMLGEPNRLKIMHALCDGERSVNRIVSDTGISQSNVSRHLALMHRHGVVARRREGNQIHYRIADPALPELCRAVCARLAAKPGEKKAGSRRLFRGTDS